MSETTHRALRSPRCPPKLLTLAAAFLAVTASRAVAAEPGEALGPVAMDSYAQTIVITLKSEAAARRARLKIAPLYHDLRAAVSTRMDDCNLNDLAVVPIMAAHGHHGTFYLNNPENWWQDSSESGIEVSGDRGSIVPPRLLHGGNSIGGHTLSHEFTPALSANAAWREIAGVRVTLESRTASPVVSFVYPFVYYRSRVRAGRDQSDLEEIIRRAGFYQLAENRYNETWDSGLQDGVFLALDGATAGYMDLSALDTAWCEAARPLFLITMHAWVRSWGGGKFPKLAELYQAWSGRADLWYCNQNQYAAYRYQAKHSRLESWVEGRTVRAVLFRPDPLDLNDATPLTLRVNGVAPDDVVSVDCPGAEVKPVQLADASAFDLFHDSSRGSVERYGRTDNPDNSDGPVATATAFEGLQARLVRDGRTLRLTMYNAGEESLRDLRVTFRLPLRWREGVVRRRAGPLARGVGTSVEISLTERDAPDHYTAGKEYDVAQIDFRGAHRARLYAVCESADVSPAAHFARDGFWRMGPFPADSAEFDLNAWAKPFLAGQEPPQPDYETPASRRIAWGALAPADASILDPDIIPTTGTSNMTDYHKRNKTTPSAGPADGVRFLLWGRIVSSRAQSVRMVTSRETRLQVAVNGRMVAADEIELQAGSNEVRMLYVPAHAVPGLDRSYDLSNYGCYFKLVDADGNRVRDIRFERPPQPRS